jgi:very-short-patch-repair endonuclease
MESSIAGKSAALLRFLKDTATLRRKRIPAYRAGDKLLWFGEAPRDRLDCRSAFLADNPAECPDLWLEVRKRRMPTRPSVPEVVKDWVRPQDLDQADQDPELLPEITVLIERRVPDPDAPPEEGRTVIEKAPEVRRLRDHPEVEDAWLEYLVNQWEPWAKEMRRWQEVQRVYEDVDFMRRRLEESEERYELVLAVGLLQWLDSTGTTIKRHLLTAPSEITLDAARGILTVNPAAIFEKFRIELDMLELHNQPRLDGTGVDDLLEELDIQAWDRSKVGEILRVLANRASPDAQVDENALKPLERAVETFRVVNAPALVLRERRPTAYEELIKRFVKASENEPSHLTTGPWERFVSEGEPSGNIGTGPVEPLNGNSGLGEAGGRLLFPLPTNEEQRRIAERLRTQSYVLVKGPPGTGKSHTIANLICHLLASGNRVLVTAHAQKALAVLRDLLPTDIRHLCVTALGSTREDHRLLEDSVRGILSQKNEWKGEKWAQEKIIEFERELCQLDDRRAQVERGLRECREAETHSHTLLGGYQGTAAQIARQLEEGLERYGWLPELSDDQIPCPMQPEDISLLAEVHSSLTQERLKELCLDVGNVPLPDPETFEQTITKLKAAERAADAARKGVSQEELDGLQTFSDVALDACRTFLNNLEEHALRASRILRDLTGEIVKDLLVGQETRWNRLAKDVAALLKSMNAACERADTARVELSADVQPQPLLADAMRRLDHFEKGGRRGFWVFAPRVMRETRYVEERCRVDGHAPREPQSLVKLVAFLELKRLVKQFSQTWPAPTAFDRLDPRRATREASDLANELNHLLELFRSRGPDALAALPVGKRMDLAESNGRRRWLAMIEAEMAIRQACLARDRVEASLKSLRSLPDGTAHPCMHNLAQAIEQRDVEKWKIAWETYDHLKAEKERFSRYQELVNQLEHACPGFRTLLNSSQGNPEWKARLLQHEKAWACSAARAWLHRVSNSDTNRRLMEERHRLQDKIEKKIEELASLSAWRAFFERLDDPTEQNLKAWTKAVDRIGKGTGKYAYRHRRTARQYLMACIPKIPAWIMPLHKLWESTSEEPGLFDTVIIDEASQAGIESLALLMLAKRIVVVGDDKQNSPEAVGVLEDDIARLARDHLHDFRYRDEFRPDTSLFDHAERAFGNLISLREHFRCVPEIIRFSNDLCYTDAPLIPLRQPPPNRLQPLRSTFLSEGSCEGEGQRITNRAEVEEIVKTIQRCLDDEAYEGKTMGVIVLQGHAQAELIEKKLAEILEQKVLEERKLRCGVPATFQGDQRDVIFLSLVIAPNHQFRALTGLPDQRRFNVAMSRARDQVCLFHSVQQHDLSREDLRWRLLSFFSSGHGALEGLYEELDRLEREAKRIYRRPGEQPDPYESWFEVDVALELLRRKYKVRPQFEVAGYRIDLVVEGLENRLAVECDGDAWHGPERYDQDLARQRQLERAGWTFVRIPESEFYANRARAVEQILDECKRLGIRPVDYYEAAASQEPAREVVSVSVRTMTGDDDDFGRQRDTDQEKPASPESDSTVKVGPFTSYSAACGFPDPREASPANVRGALRPIIEKDGPLTRESVYRLYVEGCPDLQRVGKAVRQALNRALGAMLRSGEIVQEDELSDGSPEGLVVRLEGTPKVRERPAGRRDLLEIPPSELFLVLDRVYASSASVVQDDETLARALLDHYGFNRLTEVRRKHLARILNVHRRQSEESKSGMDAYQSKAV